MQPVPPAESIQQYPELAGVLALIRAGWKFKHRHTAEGELMGVDGFRTWKPHNVTDAISIWADSNVYGCRTFNDENGIVWKKEGGLAEVANALLELHPPGHPMAPHRIIGRAPGLWTPS